MTVSAPSPSATARARARPLFALAVALAWATGWVMAVFGPRLVLKLPQVPDVSSRWVPVWCAALVAGGFAVFTCVVGLGFPLASPRVKLAMDLLPWFGLGGFAVGSVVFGGMT